MYVRMLYKDASYDTQAVSRYRVVLVSYYEYETQGLQYEYSYDEYIKGKIAKTGTPRPNSLQYPVLLTFCNNRYHRTRLQKPYWQVCKNRYEYSYEYSQVCKNRYHVRYA